MRIIFYLSWLALQLIQAFTTELFDDEAYYWVYSVFPAWGYFDHPPMIAVLIKAGYFLFSNEFGVRLFTVLLSTATIYILETLTREKHQLLFYAICASLAVIQLGGIMAVPDTPLMFFIASFFWLYRRFLERSSVVNALLLGICMAAMLYTKYHGALVVLFTVLSNPALLKKYQSYLALLTAIALFLPHLYWQYENDYPSVQFHLFERYVESYSPAFTLEFIIGQLLIAGPIAGWLLLLSASKFRPADLLERALKFTFIGFYVFFLFSTSKGRAEANWTIPAFIPMMILAHQYLVQKIRWRKWLYYSVPVTLVLVFAARIYMLIDRPRIPWLGKDEIHRNVADARAMKASAAGLPIVFLDTYQRPSKYLFYAHAPAFTLNTPNYRRNNYNFWEIEDRLIGAEVYYPHNKTTGKYFSFSRILLEDVRLTDITNGHVSLNFRSVTPENYLKILSDPAYRDVRLYLAVYEKKKVRAAFSSLLSPRDISKPVQENIVSFDLSSLPKGKYTGKLCFSTSVPGSISVNSTGFEIEID